VRGTHPTLAVRDHLKKTTNTIGMPKKIRELIQKLENTGFVNRGGKGSHRNFKHPQGVHILLSGKLGNDAKPYQERQVSIAIKKVKP